ncbi:hypothetical protein BST25_22980, partial [Mycobacterium heidelbergense]
MVGLGTAAGALLTATMTPVVAAPSAQAGVLDLIINPIIQPVMGAASTAAAAGTTAINGIGAGALAGLHTGALQGLTNSLNASAAAFQGVHSAALASITNSLTASAAAFNTGGLNAALEGLHASAAAAFSGGGLDAAVAAANSPKAALNNLVYGAFSNVYTMVYTAGQTWIASPTGQQVDGVINGPFVALFGRDLIGNGVNGFTGANTSPIGGIGANGSLADGGFLFGNGGTGAAGTAAHHTGFAGGAAGL